MTTRAKISIPEPELQEFCRKWSVSELALFGSVLRDDFSPSSDIDVLLEFDPDPGWSLLDWVRMKEDLEAIFQREVHVVEKAGLRNPYRKKHILSTYEIIYAA